MPITESTFRPAWFARGGHAQTLWAPLMRRAIALNIRRERLELPDGDFVDLDWHGEAGGRPLVVMLHGLQGSIRSAYIRGMMRALDRAGFASVLMHFRGCGGEMNRLPRAYHSGDTADLALFVNRLREQDPARPLAAIGFSLGANVLLKWLGETGAINPLFAAAAVSPPFDLERCARHIAQGPSRIYHSHLLRSLQRAATDKIQSARVDLPVTREQVRALQTLRDFDHHVTAPLHGFASAEDYYTRSSCRQFLAGIATPTLIVHARSDPFMPREAIPVESDLSPAVTLELSHDGGHVGFIGGLAPWSPGYWLERRLPAFLNRRATSGNDGNKP